MGQSSGQEAEDGLAVTHGMSGRIGPLCSAHLQLARVSHKPDVHVIMLGKALDLGQHLAHILRLRHVQRPLVIQLVVRVNHEAPDAVPAKWQELLEALLIECT